VNGIGDYAPSVKRGIPGHRAPRPADRSRPATAIMFLITAPTTLARRENYAADLVPLVFVQLSS
jgi:hypothetical protein